MLRYLFAWIFLLAFPACSWAALPGPDSGLAAGEILRGRFTEEHHVKGISSPIRSEGRFLVAPESGLIWAVEKPLPMTVVITPSGLMQGVGGVPLIHLTPEQVPFLARVTDLLSAALTGDWKALEPDIKAIPSGLASRWRVKLIPRKVDNKNMPFTSIAARGGKFVDEADLIRTDGGLDSFTFTDQSVTSQPLTTVEETAFAIVNKRK